jgi:hypothetical protein
LESVFERTIPEILSTSYSSTAENRKLHQEDEKEDSLGMHSYLCKLQRGETEVSFMYQAIHWILQNFIYRNFNNTEEKKIKYNYTHCRED